MGFVVDLATRMKRFAATLFVKCLHVAVRLHDPQRTLFSLEMMLDDTFYFYVINLQCLRNLILCSTFSGLSVVPC